MYERNKSVIAQVKKSLALIDYKLMFSLMLIQLVPTLYTTLRVFFLGQLPGEYSFSIAGQLTWINLIYEVINESIILPLYYFIGKASKSKRELNNCFKSGFIVTFCVYTVLALFIMVFIRPLLMVMCVNKDILAKSVVYIRIESIAMIFSVLANFVLVVLITLNKVRYMYILMTMRLVLCVVLDVIFVSPFSCSLNLGVNGIALSNIIVNCILLIYSLIFLRKEAVFLFARQKISFSWMKEFWKVGGISGIESFVRNFAYVVMISRMVNIVNEQGVYWIANNFIWGWLLLPIIQLGEYIKKDVATDSDAIKTKTPGYFLITTIICFLWFVTIPLWKPFMTNILLFNDVNKLYKLVVILVGFYVFFAYQNVCDSTFYGIGKTNYMLFESIVTNCLYYGMVYILYIKKIWIPTLNGIALMFGLGLVFDSLVSFGVYRYLLKKNKITIF